MEKSTTESKETAQIVFAFKNNLLLYTYGIM